MSGAHGGPEAAARGTRSWLVLGAALLAALYLAYRPALDAGFVWDDDGHVTPPHLRGADGLARIWTEPAAAQQYYPLVHTFFWVQHRLFGDAPAGYHWTNLALHAAAALLLVGLLRRLALPGAWLAGALWALHPIQVESVAWISEQKNTLSTCCFLAAWHAWITFDAGLADDRRRYGVWTLFVLLALAAVTAKTVACTLVPAILVVTWAREGGRAWTRRVPWLVLPLLLSASFAALTPWLEVTVGRAASDEHPSDLAGPLARIAVAGKDLWFYLAHLATPWSTSFVHPRWATDGPPVASLVPAAAFVALGAVLFAARGRIGRWPIATLLFFAGVLSPALGFFDAIPFRYSFVADHFQYVAGIGPIALVAACAALLARHALVPARIAAVLVLGLLAWRSNVHARNFRDAETLWRATIEANPAAWMAWANLVDELNRRGRHAEAIEVGLAGRRAHPERAGLAQNLGVALQRAGRVEEAVRVLDEAVTLAPQPAKPLVDRASAKLAAGRHADALADLDAALELAPRLAAARMLRGNALLALQRSDEALAEYDQAIALEPGFAQAWFNLGVARASRREPAEAERAYRRALELDPGELGARLNLGVVLTQLARPAEARVEFERVAQAAPGTDVGERARRALAMLDGR